MGRTHIAANTEFFERNTALVTAAPVSILCRFFCTSAADQRTIGGLFDASLPDSMFALRLQDTGGGTVLEFIVESPTVEVVVVSSTTYSLNTWQTAIGVSASATDHRVYLDNGSVGSSTTSVTPTGIDRTSIGHLGDSTPKNEFEGILAEFAVYNLAVNAADRAAYQAGISPFRIQRPNLQDYFIMEGRTGDLLSAIGKTALTDNNTVGIGNHPPIAPQFGLSGGWRGAFTVAAPAGFAHSQAVLIG